MAQDSTTGALGVDVQTNEIDDNAVTLAKLAGGSAGQVIGFDGSGDPAEISPGGTGHITLMPLSYSAIIQGTWAQSWDGSATYEKTAFTSVSTGAQNDELNYQVYIPAGTWTFYLECVVNTNMGIINLFLDADLKGTVDIYGGSPLYNQRKLITGITVAVNGLYTLKIRMATKHASSSAYVLDFTQAGLFRTA